MLYHPQALNIDSFLEGYLGLELDYQYLSNDCRYLGMTVFNDTDKVVVYNPDLTRADYLHANHGTVIIDINLLKKSQEHRYRFTLAHECGHWIFHREHFGYDPNQLSLFEYAEPYLQCREVDCNYLASNNTEWDSYRWMEWQADKFAASILMPKTSVKFLLGVDKIITPYNEVNSAIESITQTYNVSKRSAFLRLRDLHIINIPNNNEEYTQLTAL